MTSIIAAFARQRLADMEELQHDLGRRRTAGHRPGATPRAQPQPGTTPRAQPQPAAAARLSRRLSTSAGSGAS